MSTELTLPVEIEEDEFAHTCEHCHEGKDEVQDVTYRGDVQSWCNDCTDDDSFECADCSTRFHEHHACGTNTNDDTICERCAESYFRCDDCGSTCHNDDYGSDGRCCNCDRDEEQVIADYSSDVDVRPIGKAPHFYGVELEVECVSCNRECKAEEIKEDLEDFALIKEDGSLSNGFEIVTRPASLDEQRKNWQAFFPHVSGLCSFNTTTCGLHVHCSRAPLSELTVAKIICFTNAAHNRRFMSVIAGRPSGNWSKYKIKKIGQANKYNSDRYEAVNLQNSHTIEFRIFKGTLKKESIFKAIEFCDALIAFCLPAKRSLREAMMRSEFTQFVKLNAAQWPHLAAFISARWYGESSKAAQAYGFKVKDNNEEQNQTEEQ